MILPMLLAILIPVILILLYIYCKPVIEENHENIFNNDQFIDLYNYNINKIENECNCDLSQILPYPIYYINLDKDVEKRKILEYQFRKYNLQHTTRIKATDGKHDDYSFITSYDYADHLAHHQKGCFISHIHAIKTFVEQNDNDIGLIIEDDVRFAPLCKLDTTLPTIISNIPDDWDLISLNTSFCNKDTNTIQIYKRTAPREKCYSAAAYLINKKGAKKILEKCWQNESVTVNHVADDFPLYGVTDDYFYAITNSYYITPSLIFPYTPSYFENTRDVQHDVSNLYLTRGYPSWGGGCNDIKFL